MSITMDNFHFYLVFVVSWLFSGKLIVGKANKRNVFRPFPKKNVFIECYAIQSKK